MLDKNTETIFMMGTIFYWELFVRGTILMGTNFKWELYIICDGN